MLTRLMRLRGGEENSSGAMTEGEVVAMLLLQLALGLCVCVVGGEGGRERVRNERSNLLPLSFRRAGAL